MKMNAILVIVTLKALVASHEFPDSKCTIFCITEKGEMTFALAAS